MKRYACAGNREQISILPMRLDDMIAPDSEVRAIDTIADSIDIQSMRFIYAETKETGRKPYNPADMFKLYNYGYFNGIFKNHLFGSFTLESPRITMYSIKDLDALLAFSYFPNKLSKSLN